MLQLGRFPRVRLGHLSTPLEPMARLSAHLGGPKLWIERDNCTGLATGDNKTRKLEYLVADALQSNHARQTAAAAVGLGLTCVLGLEERKGTFAKDENVVFVHTGGQAGLFAYEPAFAA